MLPVTLAGIEGSERDLSYLVLWVIILFTYEGLGAGAVELIEYLGFFLYVFESSICFYHLIYSS